MLFILYSPIDSNEILPFILCMINEFYDECESYSTASTFEINEHS